MLSSGSYSDYRVIGVFRVLKDVDFNERAKALPPKRTEDGYWSSYDAEEQLIDALTADGTIEKIETADEFYMDDLPYQRPET
jgi:hypothetical protein